MRIYDATILNSLTVVQYNHPSRTYYYDIWTGIACITALDYQQVVLLRRALGPALSSSGSPAKNHQI